MKTAKKLLLLLLVLSAAGFARQRDPLTDAETDQLRNVRLEPYKRLKLLAKFTEARLDAIDQLRNDPKQADGRGAKIHDLLEDFTSLIDEINDNLDQYEGEQLDKDEHKQFRKGLKELVSDEDRFHARLRSLKHDMETDPQTKAESRAYEFALQDAEESLKSSLDTAREYAQEKDEEKPVEKKR